MEVIRVRNKGDGFVAALVDDSDHAALSQFKWYLGRNGYPTRARVRGDIVQIARHLMELGYGDPRQVDHINGDVLDNRRANLRVVTNAQNAQNRRHAGGSSAHRGVTWNRTCRKWQAAAKLNGRSHHLGLFEREEDAAAAAAAFRREHMPFANELAA